MDQRMLRDMANYLIKGGCPKEKTYAFLQASNGLTDPAVLGEILETAAKHSKRNVKALVELFVSTTQEWFYLKDLYSECAITSDEKASVRTALYELQKDGTIEHDKKADGKYRLKNHSLDIIDWQATEVGNTFDLKLPFKIHELLNIFPQNVLLFAGEKNVGKTAFANAIIKHNMARYKIRLLNSEAAGEEIKSRRLAHDDVPIDGWTDQVVACSRNFADKVLKDGVNIIDYLETPDGEFYRVVGMIRDIYEAIGNGVAIIFVQKNPKSQYGVGGTFSVEKARLVCNLTRGNPNQCFLQTVKNWKGDRNPNGLKINYHVIDRGARLKEASREWFGVDTLSTPSEIKQFNEEVKNGQPA